MDGQFGLLADYVRTAAALYEAGTSRSEQPSWSLGEYAWFMWVNRKAHTYDYKNTTGFAIPEVVRQKHIQGYLLQCTKKGGLGLSGGSLLNYVILRGIQGFLSAARRNPRARNFIRLPGQTRQFLAHSDWKMPEDPAAGLLSTTEWLLNGVKIQESERQAYLRPAYELVETIVEGYARRIRELADTCHRVSGFEAALRRLLAAISQPMFTGFLLHEVDPTFNSDPTLPSPDLAAARPWERDGNRAGDDSSYFAFIPNRRYFQYAIISAIEPYFFCGEPLPTVAHPEGETLYRTYISGAGLSLPGDGAAGLFLGAAFIVGNYDHRSVDLPALRNRVAINSSFLKSETTELARAMARVARAEFHSHLLDLIEDETRVVSDRAFIEEVVWNLHLLTDAYVRFLPWPELKDGLQACRDDCSAQLQGTCLPVWVVEDYLKRMRLEGEPIDYLAYFFEVRQPFREDPVGWGETTTIGAPVVECLLQCDAILQLPRVCVSRTLKEDERSQLAWSGHSPTVPYGPFRAYFAFPVVLATDGPEEVIGVFEFFFPLSAKAPSQGQMRELRLRVYGLVAELSASFELLRTYRTIAQSERRVERHLAMSAWISRMTHNITTGCGFEAASRELNAEIPPHLIEVLESDRPLEPSERRNLSRLVDQYGRARKTLDRAMTTVMDVETMFSTATTTVWRSAADVLSLVRRITETFVAESGAGLDLPKTAPLAGIELQLGASLLLWHVLLNAARAAGRSSGRNVEVRVSITADREALRFVVINSVDEVSGAPDYAGEDTLLESLWKSADQVYACQQVIAERTHDSVITSFYVPYREAKKSQ